MFRVLIWGESAIILGMAILGYFMMQNSENLKKSFLAKLMVIGLLVMSLVVLLFSFDSIRAIFSRIFL